MRVYKCDLCSFKGNRPCRVKTHKLTTHSDLKPLKCSHPGCSKRFKLKANMQTHLRLHESDPLLRKPFACTFKDCDYRTSQKPNLKAHVQRRHTPGRSRDFPCTLCSSRFYDRHGLTEHIGNHVREKIFECKLCTFKTHRDCLLRKHVQDLHEKSPVSCSFTGCKFVTNSKAYLTQHLKRHHPDPSTPYEEFYGPKNFYNRLQVRPLKLQS